MPDEIIKQLEILGISFLQIIEDFFGPFLQNLDPSLFQNIVLGVLAIFIPFAIVFLTDILNSKKDKKSKFEKMVLNDEVFGTRKIFWLSMTGIIFFAFFTGTNIPILAKIISVLFSLLLAFRFWSSFKNILRFSEGNKLEFEISFLEKLNFSNILRFKNTIKSKKMIRAWNSFWSEKSEFNEREFTKIFISHIDDAVKFRKLGLAIQLSKTYLNNIKKRGFGLIGYEILPKVFEWNEKLWNEKQLCLKSCNTEERIQNFFSQKYPSIFKIWALNIYKKFHLKRNHFWNWHYFGKDFFQIIIETLLREEDGSYSLFLCFKKHVEESDKKLNKISNDKEKERYGCYIAGLFASFCPTLFNIDSTLSNHKNWKYDFPPKWKISMKNIKNRVPQVILHEFLQWSQKRIFQKDHDKNLTEVISGIFLNIDSSLFTAFLQLYFSTEIKDALEKNPNFHILNTCITWWEGEKNDEEIRNIISERESSQKKETIQVILNFFHFWRTLKIFKEDLSSEEFKDWKSLTEEERKLIIKRIRKDKLKKIEGEIKSKEIREICKDSDQKELYRKEFLELIELLLLETKK